MNLSTRSYGGKTGAAVEAPGTQIGDLSQQFGPRISATIGEA